MVREVVLERGTHTFEPGLGGAVNGDGGYIHGRNVHGLGRVQRRLTTTAIDALWPHAMAGQLSTASPDCSAFTARRCLPT